MTKLKGTLPFLAVHLLTTIESEMPQHSPIHDLESCLWVSLWVSIHIILDRTEKCDNKSRAEDERVLLKLMPKHSDLQSVGSAKEGLLSYMDMRLSKNFTPFRSILLELASTANTYYKRSVARQREGKQFTTEEIEDAFAAYMKIFERYMPQEETWEYLHQLKSQ